MEKMETRKQLEKMIRHAIDLMGVAVTIIDTEGRLLYYNRHAEKILDRKPEYIGEDLRTHHKKPASNEKFDAMMLAFEQGRTESFRYEAGLMKRSSRSLFHPSTLTVSSQGASSRYSSRKRSFKSNLGSEL